MCVYKQTEKATTKYDLVHYDVDFLYLNRQYKNRTIY